MDRFTSLRDHLEKLRAFVVIAKLGSIRRAGAELRLSQPALTQSIHLLEAAVGSPLFRRHPRGVILTAQGQLVLDFSEKLFRGIDALEGELTSLSTGSPSGHLRIGTFETLAARLWPASLKTVWERFPSVKLSLKSDKPSRLAAMLFSGEVDLVVATELEKRPDWVVRPLFEESYSFFASPKKVERTTLAGLDRQHLIGVPGAELGTGRTLTQELWSLGVKSQLTCELDTFETAREYALQGLGIAILPLTVAAPALRSKKIREVLFERNRPIRFGRHAISATYRTGDEANPLLALVLSTLDRA